MPRINIDYSNTVIYKITCDDKSITNTYVGHTTNFIQKKYVHKQNCIKTRKVNNKCEMYDIIRKNGGWENWKMEILDFFNCVDHNAAIIKEQEYYKILCKTSNNVNNVNNIIPNMSLIKSLKLNNLDYDFFKKENSEIKSKNVQNNGPILKKTNKKNAKTAKIYHCKFCDFTCYKESNYTTHLGTRRHELLTNPTLILKKMPEFIWHECSCGKKYKHAPSLNKHQKMCISINSSTNSHVNTGSNAMMSLLNQNIELQKQIVELCKEKNTVINNTINNKFNLNVFLNEQCKDALNIMDFVSSLKFQLSDLENVGKLGYTEGISKIFIKGLQELDVFKRPIHCSDLKREIMYIKDKDAWEKEKENNDILKVAIKHIAHNNVKQLPDWIQENPSSNNHDTKKHQEYIQILNESMGASTEEEDIKNYNRIIKNVAKEVVIDKI
jgi:hypothetical protein